VREGSALLQGLATYGACGRRLRTHYTGRTASPGYNCAGKNIVDGRGIFCLSVGAVQIDDAVVSSTGSTTVTSGSFLSPRRSAQAASVAMGVR
jgi:hypothetical protein